jgi:hypothetical protein
MLVSAGIMSVQVTINDTVVNLNHVTSSGLTLSIKGASENEQTGVSYPALAQADLNVTSLELFPDILAYLDSKHISGTDITWLWFARLIVPNRMGALFKPKNAGMTLMSALTDWCDICSPKLGVIDHVRAYDGMDADQRPDTKGVMRINSLYGFKKVGNDPDSSLMIRMPKPKATRNNVFMRDTLTSVLPRY